MPSTHPLSNDPEFLQATVLALQSILRHEHYELDGLKPMSICAYTGTDPDAPRFSVRALTAQHTAWEQVATVGVDGSIHFA